MQNGIEEKQGNLKTVFGTETKMAQTAADIRLNIYRRPYRVLVADDDEFMHAIIRVCLRKTSYLLSFTNNGAEALRIIESDPPDILIADGLMPVVSGFELIEEIKSRTQTASIPVILLTPIDHIETPAMDAAEKADIRLTKPFKVGSILESLKMAEELVERTRQQQVRVRDTSRFFVRWRLSQ